MPLNGKIQTLKILNQIMFLSHLYDSEKEKKDPECYEKYVGFFMVGVVFGLCMLSLCSAVCVRFPSLPPFFQPSDLTNVCL